MHLGELSPEHPLDVTGPCQAFFAGRINVSRNISSGLSPQITSALAAWVYSQQLLPLCLLECCHVGCLRALHAWVMATLLDAEAPLLRRKKLQMILSKRLYGPVLLVVDLSGIFLGNLDSKHR